MEDCWEALSPKASMSHQGRRRMPVVDGYQKAVRRVVYCLAHSRSLAGPSPLQELAQSDQLARREDYLCFIILRAWAGNGSMSEPHALLCGVPASNQPKTSEVCQGPCALCRISRSSIFCRSFHEDDVPQKRDSLALRTGDRIRGVGDQCVNGRQAAS